MKKKEKDSKILKKKLKRQIMKEVLTSYGENEEVFVILIRSLFYCSQLGHTKKIGGIDANLLASFKVSQTIDIK